MIVGGGESSDIKLSQWLDNIHAPIAQCTSTDTHVHTILSCSLCDEDCH